MKIELESWGKKSLDLKQDLKSFFVKFIRLFLLTSLLMNIGAITYAATIVDVTYTEDDFGIFVCPDGTIDVGGHDCKKTELKSVNMACPAGTTDIGPGTNGTCSTKESTAPTMVCPSGTSLNAQGKCMGTTNESRRSETGAMAQCSPSFFNNGGITARFDFSPPSYNQTLPSACFSSYKANCPSGYYNSGDDMYRCSMEINLQNTPCSGSYPVVHSSYVSGSTTWYRCAKPGVSPGANMSVGPSSPACNSGDTLFNEVWCAQTSSPQTPSWSISCPAGYSADSSNNRMCVKTEWVAVQIERAKVPSCTNGFIYNSITSLCEKGTLTNKVANGCDSGWTLLASGSECQKISISKAEKRTPEIVSIPGSDNNNLFLPAVGAEYKHPNGSNALTTAPFKTMTGSTLTGKYDVKAILRGDSKIPLSVNGLTLNPGDALTVASNYDFTASGGVLSLPLSTPSPTQGTSTILFYINDGNAQVVQVGVTLWTSNVEVTAKSWTVKQLAESIQIDTKLNSGSPCAITLDESKAKAANFLLSPTCLIEFSNAPIQAKKIQNAYSVSITGRVEEVGVLPIGYTLSLYDSEGKKWLLDSGEKALTLTPLANEITFGPKAEIPSIVQTIQSTSFALRQTAGPSCGQTVLDTVSKNAWVKTPSSPLVCHIEWTQIPNGLSQDTSTDIPILNGNLLDTGSNTITWTVNAYSEAGTKFVLSNGSYTFNVMAPAAPEIDLLTKYLYKDNIYMVPLAGQYLGDLTVQADKAPVNIAIARNTEVLEAQTFPPTGGIKNKIYRRISTDTRALWEETGYTASAGYKDLPEVKSEKVFRAIAAPAYSIKPVISVDSTSVLNTDEIKITVKMQDQYKPNDTYSADTMGQWKARLIIKKSYTNIEPLTEYIDMVDGVGSFTITLPDMNTSSLRIFAQASLISPVEGYTRIEESNRPALLTILRGGAIEGSVSSKRISGEAPLSTVLKLTLTESLDLRATGKVVWMLSSDNQATWEEIIPDERYKYQMLRTFEKGNYFVKARITNKNSNIESTTETIEVVAYNKPKLKVDGPTNMFETSTGNYTASVTYQDAELDDSDVLIEWSTDGGVSYPDKGKTFSITSDVSKRVKLWARARMLDAPEEDEYAFALYQGAVEFKPIKAPSVYVSGPSLIETGKTYKFKAETRLPFLGMQETINGFFTLPNGEIVEGVNEVEYTPSDEDLTKETVQTSYTAWIEGFREKGSVMTHTLKSRVWQYKWPEFALQIQQDAKVSPAKVIATLRAVAFTGKLESPSYTWTLPVGSVETDTKQPHVRGFTLSATGDQTISVIVKDGRGHESVVEAVINLTEALPYEVTLNYSGSNTYNREPLDILVRPYISGGHTRDRILSREYTVNGQPLSIGSSIYARTKLEAGEHEVKLKVLSEMGAEAQGVLSINVQDNVKPTCEITSRDTVGSWIIYSACTDVDGRMKSFKWLINGEATSLTSDRITISKGTYNNIRPSVTLVGIDDSGEESEPVDLQ